MGFFPTFLIRRLCLLDHLALAWHFPFFPSFHRVPHIHIFVHHAQMPAARGNKVTLYPGILQHYTLTLLRSDQQQWRCGVSISTDTIPRWMLTCFYRIMTMVTHQLQGNMKSIRFVYLFWYLLVANWEKKRKDHEAKFLDVSKTELNRVVRDDASNAFYPH